MRHFLPRQQHISGALFFDIDLIVDVNNPLAHTLPSAEQFSEVAYLNIKRLVSLVQQDEDHDANASSSFSG